jgi:hypothetical protein
MIRAFLCLLAAYGFTFNETRQLAIPSSKCLIGE